MKKFLLVLLLLIVGAGVFYYFYSSKKSSQDQIHSLSLVPSDAIYVIKTNEPIKTWQSISTSPTWKFLQTNTFFADVTSGANSLDSMINDNKKVFDLLGSRTLVLSAHMINAKEYDFLFILDVEDASGIKVIEDLVSNITWKEYVITKEEIQDTKVICLHNNAKNTNIYLSFLDNYLLCSFDKSIISNALDRRDDHHIVNHAGFRFASAPVAGEGMFRVYLNYSMLSAYMNCYTSSPNEYVDYLSKSLMYSALAFDLKNDDVIKLQGYTTVNDSMESYVKALAASGSGRIDLHRVIPQRCAFYMGMGFTDFSTFFNNLELQMQKDVAKYNEYNTTMKKVEKFVGIDVRRDFMSWINDEIAFVELPSANGGKHNEYALFLKAKDIETAKRMLDHMNKQIRKTTPVKFKSVEYKGYQINFLSIKGFWRLFLGKLFDRFDKPYYTIIGNSVIYSNHPNTLMSIIDDYVSGKTLYKSEEYMNFLSNLNSNTTLHFYVQTPHLMTTMKSLVSSETSVSMETNKKYFNAFRHISMQLTSDGSKFKTSLIAKVYPESTDQSTSNLPNEAVVLDTLTTDSLFVLPEIYPSDPNAKEFIQYRADSSIQFVVKLKNGFPDGNYTEYYSNNEIRLKGDFKSGQRQGLWKVFDSTGVLIQKRKYKSGIAVQ